MTSQNWTWLMLCSSHPCSWCLFCFFSCNKANRFIRLLSRTSHHVNFPSVVHPVMSSDFVFKEVPKTNTVNNFLRNKLIDFPNSLWLINCSVVAELKLTDLSLCDGCNFVFFCTFVKTRLVLFGSVPRKLHSRKYARDTRVQVGLKHFTFNHTHTSVDADTGYFCIMLQARLSVH